MVRDDNEAVAGRRKTAGTAATWSFGQAGDAVTSPPRSDTQRCHRTANAPKASITQLTERGRVAACSAPCRIWLCAVKPPGKIGADAGRHLSDLSGRKMPVTGQISIRMVRETLPRCRHPVESRFVVIVRVRGNGA